MKNMQKQDRPINSDLHRFAAIESLRGNACNYDIENVINTIPWRTGDGEYIFIKDMETDHLVNAINQMYQAMLSYKGFTSIPIPSVMKIEILAMELLNRGIETKR